MSNMDLARRTSVRVVFDGADITGSILKYLDSITYTDNEADETDDLQIRLHDRDGVWLANWLCGAIDAAASNAPNSGFTISASFIRENWNSDGRDLVLDCGQFELDAVSADGPPSTVFIKGTSLPYGSGLRQTLKNRAWEAVRLSSVASEIADSGGLGFLFDSLRDPFYKRLEQVWMSDIAFLSRLCRDAGVSLKVTDNIVVLFDQVEYESKPPVFDIMRGDGRYLKWSLNTGSAGTKYSSCRVSCIDLSTGRAIEGVAYEEAYREGGKYNVQLEVAAKVDCAEDARVLAEKRLRLVNKYGLTAQFLFPGNPVLVAGVTVTLSGWGKWCGKYIVSQALHRVGSSGYTTQVKLRKVLEGY